VNVSPDKLNDVRTTVQVFERGLNEIMNDAITVTLELMEQGSLTKAMSSKL